MLRLDFPGKGAASLTDALCALPTTAAANFCHILTANKSIAPARLACKAIRDFLDGHVPELIFEISASDRDPWPTGHPPFTARWPKSHAVTLRLHPKLVGQQTLIESIAVLPFTGVDANARLQITRLRVEVFSCALPRQVRRGHAGRTPSHVLHAAPRDSEAAVPALVALLPNLRELDLEALRGISSDHARQRKMCESLATLQHLQALSLPGHELLNHIGILAACGSLRRLRVGRPERQDLFLICKEACRGVSKLQSLAYLDLQGCKVRPDDPHQHQSYSVGATLRQLLDSLPPSLRELSVNVDYDGRLSFAATLQSCHLTSVRVRSRPPKDGAYHNFWELPDVKDYAAVAWALLASRVMPPASADRGMLKSINVGAVAVRFKQSLDRSVLQPLRGLLRRCEVVDVEELHVAPDTAKRVIKLLRCKPRWLVMGAAGGHVRLALRKGEAVPKRSSSAAAGEQMAGLQPAPVELRGRKRVWDFPEEEEGGRMPLGNDAAGGAAAAAAPASAGSLPAASDIVQRVLQRLVSGAPPDSTSPPLVEPMVPLEELLAGTRLGTEAGNSCMNGDSEHAACSPSSSASRPEAPAGADTVMADEEPPGEEVLLLRGSLLAVLVKAPEPLASWLLWLSKQAQTVARRARTAKRDGGLPLQHYQVLPACMSGVLVECKSAVAAKAVAAAARSVVEGQSAGLLEVVTVTGMSGVPTQVNVPRCGQAYLAAVEEVLQELWDGRAGAGVEAAGRSASAASGRPAGSVDGVGVGGGSERAWLKLLLEAAKELCGVPRHGVVVAP